MTWYHTRHRLWTDCSISTSSVNYWQLNLPMRTLVGSGQYKRMIMTWLVHISQPAISTPRAVSTWIVQLDRILSGTPWNINIMVHMQGKLCNLTVPSPVLGIFIGHGPVNKCFSRCAKYNADYKDFLFYLFPALNRFKYVFGKPTSSNRTKGIWKLMLGLSSCAINLMDQRWLIYERDPYGTCLSSIWIKVQNNDKRKWV